MPKAWTRVFLLIAALLADGGSAQQAVPRTSDPAQLRQQLWNLINNGDTRKFQTPGILASNPFYRQTSGARPPWHLFPASAQQPPDTFLNRRLGLPVHGRWVSTYVNTLAFDCIKNNTGCSRAPGAQQIRLAPGAIVVKENDPNVTSPQTVARRTTPGVITVLWKPFAGYCGSRLPFNAPRRAQPDGDNCFGGEWLYAFYILQNPHLDEAATERFDGFVTSDNNAQGFCINCHAPAFRADYLRGLLAQWRQPVVPARQPEVPAAEELAGLPFCQGEFTLSPELPSDVPLDPLSIPSPLLRQQMFDCFSWRSFVALNWPGGWDRRGQPDTSRSFGDFAGPEEPAVWQTYRATWEVFQPDRGLGWVPPRQFSGPRPAPSGLNCPADSAGMLTVTRPVLTMISKSRVGGLEGGVGNETGQAFAGQFGTLADRNGRLVRYEVAMNAAEFAYLVNNGFAGNSRLTPAGPRSVDTSFPNGAVEIKAAWKELCVDRGCILRDDPTRYFTRPVLIYNEAIGTCEPQPRLMGLVGLHIAQKTARAPQWIWSTFEHVDNVPPIAGDAVDPAVPPQAARFNDPNCRQDENFCFWRPFLAGKGLNPSPCCPNVTLNRFPGFGFFEPDGRPTPNQLTRLDPIQGSGLNQRFQQIFAGLGRGATPFQYYVLVSTQWPLNGRDRAGLPNLRRCAYASEDGERSQQVGADCYTLVPEDLRNSVIESYMTDYYNDRQGRPVQRSNRSCMGCHGDAGADFSYIFLDAVEQRVPIQTP